MRNLRRFLTYALLTVYGATALLGYGLHMLAPDAHHHGLGQVVCVEHAERAHSDHDVCGHTGPESDCEVATIAVISASSGTDTACDGDACFVCDFLGQVRSTLPQMAASIVWQHVATEAAPFTSPITAQATLGPQAPRGPPLSAA